MRNLTHGRTGWLLLGGALALLALSPGVRTAQAALAGVTLIFNGKPASADVRLIEGQAYVPLADVAKALGMVVVKRGENAYEITKPGGANQVQGLQGKVGDLLFDGKWRFQVLEASVVDSHAMKHKVAPDFAVYNAVAEFDDGKRVFKAKPGRVLVAIKCRVINGRNAKQALWLAAADTRTALADADGESHPPIVYDIEESTPFQSKALLPGAKTEFTVLFSVPEDIRAKDLVFTLRTLNNSDKGTDVRVSLTEAAAEEVPEPQ